MALSIRIIPFITQRGIKLYLLEGAQGGAANRKVIMCAQVILIIANSMHLGGIYRKNVA
jgi:hypothetical protein